MATNTKRPTKLEYELLAQICDDQRFYRTFIVVGGHEMTQKYKLHLESDNSVVTTPRQKTAINIINKGWLKPYRKIAFQEFYVVSEDGILAMANYMQAGLRKL